MHPYATDSRERLLVPFWLVVISILLALGLSFVLALTKVIPPWWLDVPSVFGLFAILLRLMDRRAWRWRVLRKIQLVRVPDLGGTWNGSVTSSHAGKDGAETAHDVTVQITQSWTQLSVSFETPLSRSKSEIGAILLATGSPNPLLAYSYWNEPKAMADPAMHAHRGTVLLDIRGRGKEMEGQYYTGRDRVTYGTLRLKRVGAG